MWTEMLPQILASLPQDYPWREEIRYFDTIGSTNTYLKEQASLGAPHGTAAIADCQTLGRGRLGRSFQSPKGRGIYLSILLRPGCAPQALMHLTCAAAVAMCDAVEETAGLLRSRLKNGCTGCRYCLPCPKGVDIPGNFRIWNNMAMYGNLRLTKRAWRELEPGARGDQCVSCGRCEGLCPQHIPIREHLARLTGEVEGFLAP